MQQMLIKARANTQLSSPKADKSCLSAVSGTPTTATRQKKTAMLLRDECSATAKLEKLKAIYQKQVSAVAKTRETVNNQ